MLINKVNAFLLLSGRRKLRLAHTNLLNYSSSKTEVTLLSLIQK